MTAKGTKASTECVVDNHTTSALELIHESRGQADRTQKVGRDGRHEQPVVDDTPGLIRFHDSSVIDENIQIRVFSGQLLDHCFDTVRVCDIEFHALDTRIGLRDGVQMALASARDDDFVSTLVQFLGQSAANPRTAAGNEDGVSSEIHNFSNQCGVIVA